ncbi:MAG TPA: MFS transporter, partial [Planctomycetaceae bacterium]|nr:MFS transporter [Planctomycetaceae bacterium]
EGATEFDRLKVEQEALTLLQSQRRGDKLDSASSQRLNRLLLEAIFPNNLGKVYVRGWRPVMIIYGCAGLLVGAWYWLIFRDRPEIHPRCNAAEQALIVAGRPANAPSTHGKAGAIPWGRLLKSRSLWLDSMAQIGTNIGWAFLATRLPTYLSEVHHVDMIMRSWLTAIPTIGGIIGMWWGGTLTDWLTSRVGLRWGRSLPLAITRFLSAGCYVGALFASDPLTATALFVGVSFFCDLGIPAIWAFKQDVGGRYTGSILGWGNMWGNLAAAVSNPLYDAALKAKFTVIASTIPLAGQNWDAMFVMCASAMVIAGIAGLGIDASIPIAPPDEEEAQPA